MSLLQTGPIAGEKSRTFTHTSKEQKLAMVMFLEDSSNFRIITGSAIQGPPVGGKRLRKINGFKLMADFVNKKVPGSYWDAKTAKNRFELYLKAYKKTRKLSISTGWGVTESDKKKGIHTIAAKKESLCPNFERLETLFGLRQNIQPTNIKELGAIDYNEIDDIRLIQAPFPSYPIRSKAVAN